MKFWITINWFNFKRIFGKSNWPNHFGQSRLYVLLICWIDWICRIKFYHSSLNELFNKHYAIKFRDFSIKWKRSSLFCLLKRNYRPLLLLKQFIGTNFDFHIKINFDFFLIVQICRNRFLNIILIRPISL